MVAAAGGRPAPLGLAWVYDLQPAVARPPCFSDGRRGIYFEWKQLGHAPPTLLPKAEVAAELRAGPDEGAFLAAAIGPDCATALVGLACGTARTWRLSTGAPGLTLRGHGKAVNAVGWLSPAVVATASLEGVTRLWSARDGVPLLELPFPGPPPAAPLPATSLAVCADGALLLVAGGGQASLYDLRAVIAGASDEAAAGDSVTKVIPMTAGGSHVGGKGAAAALVWTAVHSAALPVAATSFCPGGRHVVLADDDVLRVLATPLKRSGTGTGGLPGTAAAAGQAATVAACPLRGEGPAMVAWTPKEALIMVGLRDGRNLRLIVHGLD